MSLVMLNLSGSDEGPVQRISPLVLEGVQTIAKIVSRSFPMSSFVWDKFCSSLDVLLKVWSLHNVHGKSWHSWRLQLHFPHPPCFGVNVQEAPSPLIKLCFLQHPVRISWMTNSFKLSLPRDELVLFFPRLQGQRRERRWQFPPPYLSNRHSSRVLSEWESECIQS